MQPNRYLLQTLISIQTTEYQHHHHYSIPILLYHNKSSLYCHQREDRLLVLAFSYPDLSDTAISQFNVTNLQNHQQNLALVGQLCFSHNYQPVGYGPSTLPLRDPGATSCYLELLDKLQKTDIQDCWSFTCCFSGTLGSLSKCSQLKSFLQVFLWYIFFRTGSTSSTSLLSRQVYSLF